MQLLLPVVFVLLLIYFEIAFSLENETMLNTSLAQPAQISVSRLPTKIIFADLSISRSVNSHLLFNILLLLKREHKHKIDLPIRLPKRTKLERSVRSPTETHLREINIVFNLPCNPKTALQRIFSYSNNESLSISSYLSP